MNCVCMSLSLSQLGWSEILGSVHVVVMFTLVVIMTPVVPTKPAEIHTFVLTDIQYSKEKLCSEQVEYNIIIICGQHSETLRLTWRHPRI